MRRKVENSEAKRGEEGRAAPQNGGMGERLPRRGGASRIVQRISKALISRCRALMNAACGAYYTLSSSTHRSARAEKELGHIAMA